MSKSLLSELRVVVEQAILRMSPVYYGVGVPCGDGAPVVLVPGALSSDCAMLEMRLWLKCLGYRSYSSDIGSVIDCPDIMVEKLVTTIERAHRETGIKVVLIGHSFGGLLAREAALQRPKLVHTVITLGSPFRRPSAHPLVMNIIGLVHGRALARHIDKDETCVQTFTRSVTRSIHPVDIAAIYTKTDPVVDWRDCIMDGESHNYEVSGTHVGLVVNQQVYRVIASLLAV